MEKKSDIFSKLIKRRKPDLPENFFADFQTGLLSDMSIHDESREFTLPKNKTPEIPADFFRNFHTGLMDEIESEKAFSDLGIKKKNKPELPLDFEENFNIRLMQKIRQEKFRGRVIKTSFWSVISVAAGLALLFTLNTKNTSHQPELIEKNTALSEEESLDTYVAYLDEEALVDYIIENDIDMGQTASENDAVYDYRSSDVEDFYLDL